MTWWAEESTDDCVNVSPRARQRIKDLHRSVREVRPCDDGWFVLQPMSGWQRWRKVDAEWAELMDEGVTEPPKKVS